MGKLRNKIILSLLLLIAIIFVGMAGYRFFGGPEWTPFDSFYQTMVAMQIVSMDEVHEFQANVFVRVFNIFLYIAGMGVLLYAGTNLASFVLEGTLTDILKKERIKRMIAKLTDHFIVCGVGETGEPVLEEMVRTGVPVVAIEKGPERAKELQTKYKDLLILEGDAAHDDVLKDAGIENARGLVAVLANDKDNLYLVMAARHLNPTMRIVAKGEEVHVQEKMRKAGADAVVYPYKIGGMRMVSESLRPSVVTFLDTMLRDNAKVFRFEEIVIPKSSHFVGKKLHDFPHEERGALLVAIKKPDGSYAFNPDHSYVLRADDVMIFMGEVAAIRKMEAKVK
ncbi:MAG: TrkA family potassium uptake protein [bacterium]